MGFCTVLQKLSVRTTGQNDLSPILFLHAFYWFFPMKTLTHLQLPTLLLLKVWACFPNTLCSQGSSQAISLAAQPWVMYFSSLSLSSTAYFTYAHLTGGISSGGSTSNSCFVDKVGVVGGVRCLAGSHRSQALCFNCICVSPWTHGNR